MRVSVVIPTVDREKVTLDLLRGLRDQVVSPHEVIVVDQTAGGSQPLHHHVKLHYEMMILCSHKMIMIACQKEARNSSGVW